MSQDELFDEATMKAVINLPIRNLTPFASSHPRRNLHRRHCSSSDVDMDAPAHNGKRIHISVGSGKKVKTEKTSNKNTDTGRTPSAVSKPEADSDHHLYKPGTEYEAPLPKLYSASDNEKVAKFYKRKVLEYVKEETGLTAVGITNLEMILTDDRHPYHNEILPLMQFYVRLVENGVGKRARMDWVDKLFRKGTPTTEFTAGSFEDSFVVKPAKKGKYGSLYAYYVSRGLRSKLTSCRLLHIKSRPTEITFIGKEEEEGPETSSEL